MAANCLPVVLLAAVMGAATTVSSARAAGTVDGAQAAVRAEGRVVHYDGRITQASVAAVRMLLEADGSLKELAIRSGGGDVEAGLALGGLVRDRGLDVRVVGDVCMSSCANYVFPAGRRKIVESGALVIWHGSMIQKNLLEDFDYSGVQKQLGRPPTWWERWSMKRTARQWLRRISAEQAAFYARIGVDPRITVLGQLQDCGCNWTVTVADMAKFGIDSVAADPAYGMPGYGRWDGEWRLVADHPQPPAATGQR